MGGDEAKVQPGQSSRQKWWTVSKNSVSEVSFLQSHRPCLKMTGYLFMIASPDSVFSFNHALLTEIKTLLMGLSWLMWGVVLQHYRVRHKVLKDHFVRLL